MQRIKISGGEFRLPDFIIVGAAKSGTTSVSRYLSGHPQLALPESEAQFFAFLNNPPDFQKQGQTKILSDWESYRAYLPEASSTQLLGEKSVSYLYVHWHETVIRNFHKFYPDSKKLKIIILLRNPVERAYSQYLYNRQFHERLSFSNALLAWDERRAKNWVPAYDYIGGGLYFEAVKAYMENFPLTKVLFHEDLENDKSRLLRDLFEFLGVDSTFIPENRSVRYNVSAVPKNRIVGLLFKHNPVKHLFRKVLTDERWNRLRDRVKTVYFEKPPLDGGVRVKLSGIFKEDVKKLQGLLKKGLSHWLAINRSGF